MAFTITTVGGVTTITGTSGDDSASAAQLAGLATITAEAFEGADLIQLGAGQNGSSFKMGKDGDTFLDAGVGLTNSEVKLGQGDDTFGNGVALSVLINAAIRGGKGIDVITTGAVTTSSSVNGGKAADVINTGVVTTNGSVSGGDGNDGITVAGITAAGQVFGGAGDDRIVSTVAGDGTGTIFGGEGNDQITATFGGGEIIFGGGGNDAIATGAGADAISGEGGNDNINGGAGIDTLSGGAGTNTFVFATPLAVASDVVTDVITDWNAGENNAIDFANALNKLTNTAAAAGIAINGAGIITGAATLQLAADYFQTVDTVANATAIWTNGSSSFLFVSNATAGAGDGNDVIQLNNIVATGYTINGAGNISAIS